jgi:hypothetical protein
MSLHLSSNSLIVLIVPSCRRDDTETRAFYFALFATSRAFNERVERVGD